MCVHLVRFGSNCRVLVNVNKHGLAKTAVDFATAVRTSPFKEGTQVCKNKLSVFNERLEINEMQAARQDVSRIHYQFFATTACSPRIIYSPGKMCRLFYISSTPITAKITRFLALYLSHRPDKKITPRMKTDVPTSKFIQTWDAWNIRAQNEIQCGLNELFFKLKKKTSSLAVLNLPV